jgi:hypothetical protein
VFTVRTDEIGRDSEELSELVDRRTEVVTRFHFSLDFEKGKEEDESSEVRASGSPPGSRRVGNLLQLCDECRRFVESEIGLISSELGPENLKVELLGSTDLLCRFTVERRVEKISDSSAETPEAKDRDRKRRLTLNSILLLRSQS